MLTSLLEADSRSGASRARSAGRGLGIILVSFLPYSSLTVPALAAEVYVVRFITSGTLVEPPCKYLRWNDHLLFHNTASQAATVRFLGVSNGPPRADASNLTVPAGRSRSVAGTLLGWNPNGNAVLWVNRLDVPDGVLLASRLEVAVGSGAPCAPASDGRGVGATGLPTFSSLRAPNERQYHLATDIGADATGYAANARINVGIYNAGSMTATATVEVHRGCDERLMESRTTSIPADSILQVLGLSTRTGPGCGSPFTTNLYTTYVIVRVDQPSFSYAVTLSNELPPQIPIGVSLTH